MKKRLFITIAIVVMLIFVLCYLTSNPIISVPKDVPEHYVEAIKSQSKGVYSNVLPLVPVYVSVDNLSANRVYYTIHYFPFGTVGMSYTEGDGYNIEKPSTNQ